VVVYGDNSIALPLLTAHALARHEPRPLKRLYRKREVMLGRLVDEYHAALASRDQRAQASVAVSRPAGGAETVGR
jgi:deoxyhypusine synthase